jgi:hypothetical protein
MDGCHELLTQVTGPGLARLSARARRRLLGHLLSEPAASDGGGTVTVRWPAPPDLLIYLALGIPRRQLFVVHEPGVRGVGVTTTDGSGATIAAFPVDSLGRGEKRSAAMLRPRRRRWRIERYGKTDPTLELTDLLEEWRGLARARRTRFQITARRSNALNAELGFGWVA